MRIDQPYITDRTVGSTSRSDSSIITGSNIRGNGEVIRKQLDYVLIPAFYVSSAWRGASEMLLRASISLSKRVSFPLIEAPKNSNFLLCISYLQDGSVVRYKAWEDIGELLYVPVYAGHVLPKDFRLEFWNIGNNEISMQSDWILTASTFTKPTRSGYCSYTNARTNLYPDFEFCLDNQMPLTGFNPSYDNYWSFDYCGGSNIIGPEVHVLGTEEGEYFVTEEGEMIRL